MSIGPAAWFASSLVWNRRSPTASFSDLKRSCRGRAVHAHTEPQRDRQLGVPFDLIVARPQPASVDLGEEIATSCPESSSRSGTIRPRGWFGSAGSSRSSTSSPACRSRSSAPHFTGPTSWSSLRGGLPGSSSRFASSAGNHEQADAAQPSSAVRRRSRYVAEPAAPATHESHQPTGALLVRHPPSKCQAGQSQLAQQRRQPRKRNEPFARVDAQTTARRL